MSVPTPRPWFEIKNAADPEVAEVSIYDEISPWGVTAQDFVRELKAITAPLVKMHLNSPGGDVYDGIAIFNAIKDHPATFNVYIPGLAASIATVIAMAGDEIAIAPHARMMIHDAWAFAVGNAEDMAKLAERLEATSQNLAEIYAERAPEKTAGEWRDLMRAETWYTDQEAVDAGLADSVGRSNDPKSLRQASLFNLSRYREGERIAASLRAELGPDDPLPENAHVCTCGGGDACPLNKQEPEPSAPEQPENKHVRVAEALEAAIQGVSKEAYLW